jgi:hypothetical protein
MNFDFVGTIRKIGATQEVGEKKFPKRELILTVTEGEYTLHPNIEFVGDKTELLDKFKVGQEVKVRTNFRANLWKNKQQEETSFNSFQGWKIDLVNTLDEVTANTTNEDIDGAEDTDDDLPF